MIEIRTSGSQAARLSQAPGAAAGLVEPLMIRAAGPHAAAVSLALDYASPWSEGEAVTARAWVERETRTLVFVHAAIARAADEALLCAASMVFRKVSQAPAGA